MYARRYLGEVPLPNPARFARRYLSNLTHGYLDRPPLRPRPQVGLHGKCLLTPTHHDEEAFQLCVARYVLSGRSEREAGNLLVSKVQPNIGHLEAIHFKTVFKTVLASTSVSQREYATLPQPTQNASKTDDYASHWALNRIAEKFSVARRTNS
jgi:hypothetical protein